jgi:hypothetical protein
MSPPLVALAAFRSLAHIANPMSFGPRVGWGSGILALISERDDSQADRSWPRSAATPTARPRLGLWAAAIGLTLWLFLPWNDHRFQGPVGDNQELPHLLSAMKPTTFEASST